MSLSNTRAVWNLARVFCHGNKRTLFTSNCFRDKNERKDGQVLEETETTHYGFETVTPSEKSERVYNVFEKVASKYDLMNDVMSAGIHRAWKDYFVGKMTPIPRGTKVLDVAGGTGDIAFRILNNIKEQDTRQVDGKCSGPSQVLVCDINQAMLDVGKQRLFNLGATPNDTLSWVCADAQCLPMEDNTFDLYTIAFGIRNVVNIPKALSEAYRVLRSGGRFLCLEFSYVPNPALRWLYDTYSFQVIPPMGELIAGDWKSYQYLVESIRKFPNQEVFKEMIEEAGFHSVTYENLTFGVAAIHSGYKI